MDTVGNMLTALVNGARVGKERIAVPYSGFNERLVRLMQEKGMVDKVRVQEGVKAKLVITLAYEDGRPKLQRAKRVSKPGNKIYAGKDNLPWRAGRTGFYILSTSKGLMDEVRARREGVGGELVCEVWS